MTYNFRNKHQDSNFLGVEPLEFEEESQSTEYMSSQVVSPLTNRYRVRLSKPPMRKRRKITRNSIILQSSTTSDTEEPLITNEMNTLSSSKSMPDTIPNQSTFRFDSDKSSHSDRFIPSRFEFGTNCRDSFNMTDKLYNSPLSLMRNKNKKRKSVDSNVERIRNHNSNEPPNGYKSDSSHSNQKYDECLQNVLLTKQSLFTHIVPNNDQITNNCNTNDNFMNEYHHHLQECQHFNSGSNTNNKTPNCICKYVVNERLNYNDSPRKVFKFNSINENNDHDNDNDNINISCLPNTVNTIMQNNKNGVIDNNNLTATNDNPNVLIPSDPIKTIDLSTKHKYKQLLNDYYYHLMDFKINENFGCIAIKDSLHLIRGHFGDLDFAEQNKYISSLNRRANISRREYHFCSIKLSPNNNSTNPHILCLGDNFGRLLFYDYIRASYISTIYKSNECRISVIDWKNHYNSNNGIIAVGSLDKYIRIYDDRFCQQIYKLKYHRGEVCGLRWNQYNEHLLLSGGNQNIVCCWDIRKNKNPLFVGKHKAAIRALTWYPDCDNMFISGGGSNDQCIKIWNINYKKERLSLLTGSQVCNLECLQYNNRNYLVSSHGFSSNSVIIWNMNHRINSNKNKNNIHLTRIKQLSGHKCRVLYFCKYSDCNIVSASAGPDQTMKYWKIFPNQLETPFMHHMQNVIR